jgi:site-specific recombinase XerD
MKEFTAYLQSKDLAEATQNIYLRYVNSFLKWYKTEPINCTKKDIIKYLAYLKNKKQHENITRRNTLLAINHYFTFLLRTEAVVTNPTTFLKIRGANKKKLYNIFTYEELTQLADDYYHNFVRNYNDNHIPKNQRKQSYLSKERNYLMLSFLLNQGLTTRELQRIDLEDLDLIKATLKITGAKKSNKRNIPLNASQIGSLMHYTQNIRPQFLEFLNTETNQLFLPLPEAGRTKVNNNENPDLMGVIKNLSKQIKTLEKSFLNFKQIRASVITHWIKTVGLRKAQYYAGHRYISSTENYLPNDLESLTEDIAKFNPF